MKPTTIFITYNPEVSIEQTLAIRLHTIGAVNGFKMYLPDRYNSETYLDDETKNRINEADFVVLFALKTKLSKIVKQEIEYAWERLQDKSKILVIYPTQKTLKGSMTEHFTEIYFDPKKETVVDVNTKVMNVISQKITDEKNIAGSKEQSEKNKKDEQVGNALMAFLGIGLGLLILNEITKK